MGRGHGATRAWPVSLAALAGGERPAAVTHRERDVRCRRRPSRVVHLCGFRLWGHVSAGLAARAWTPAPEAGAARITERRVGIASRRWARSSGGRRALRLRLPPPGVSCAQGAPGASGAGQQRVNSRCGVCGLNRYSPVRGVKGKSADVAYMLGPHPDVYTF